MRDLDSAFKRDLDFGSGQPKPQRDPDFGSHKRNLDLEPQKRTRILGLQISNFRARKGTRISGPKRNPDVGSPQRNPDVLGEYRPQSPESPEI